jgi:hypothetical protein
MGIPCAGDDIERCNLSARAVALAYNWWSWYVRLAHPKARLEAVTSRPMLLAAIGRITESGGQKRILLSLTHAAANHVKALVANVRETLAHVLATAPQFAPGPIMEGAGTRYRQENYRCDRAKPGRQQRAAAFGDGLAEENRITHPATTTAIPTPVSIRTATASATRHPICLPCP